MLSRLLGRITGADKGKKYPDQQGSSLGRSGDFIIIYPYGLYCDLPSGAMFRNIGNGIAIPAAIDRPAEAAQGEPVFYHPPTNSFIIARNNGDLDIQTGNAGGGDVNITCANANITATATATIDTPSATITGDLQVDGDLNITGNASLGVGGAAIARVGDTVVAGVIATGSANHTAS